MANYLRGTTLIAKQVDLTELVSQAYQDIYTRFSAYPSFNGQCSSQFPADLIYRRFVDKGYARNIVFLGAFGDDRIGLTLDLVRQLSLYNEIPTSCQLFTLSRAPMELITRLLSRHSRVGIHKLKSGNLSGDDWKLLASAAGELAESNISISKLSPFLNNLTGVRQKRSEGQGSAHKIVVIDSMGCRNPTHQQDSIRSIESIRNQINTIRGDAILCLIDLPQSVLNSLPLGHLFERFGDGLWAFTKPEENASSNAVLMVGERQGPHRSIYALNYNHEFDCYEYLHEIQENNEKRE